MPRRARRSTRSLGLHQWLKRASPCFVVGSVVASGRGFAAAARSCEGGVRRSWLRSSIKGSPRVERNALSASSGGEPVCKGLAWHRGDLRSPLPGSRATDLSRTGWGIGKHCGAGVGSGLQEARRARSIRMVQSQRPNSRFERTLRDKVSFSGVCSRAAQPER